ncbi:cytochrome P450 family protein [Actinokineospora terrae]|uniref:cytochrome P450 family protein n=1 Tax=Actinokineospora terrae TaxID=155974 RepID=UPI0015A62192|nr:cytochrome P450 [Actinokineospora terrae]
MRVIRLPTGVRAWVIADHAQARAALTDARLRKSARSLREIIGAVLAGLGHPADALHVMFSDHMAFADPPDHTRLRRLVGGVFTRHRMRALLPRVEAITTDLLDSMDTVAGPVDLVGRLAAPLPMAVIGDLLGIPAVDHDRLHRWTAVLMEEDPAQVGAASTAMGGYVADLVEAKRSRPGDDLVSALVTAHDDGDRLDPAELVAMVVLLIVAGHETTANAIGNAAVTLLERPHRWRELGRDPDLLPDAVEELLRLGGALRHTTYRYTGEPVTYGTTTIPAGEIVLIGLAEANRDPAVFDAPADYRPGRPRIRSHLAFGHGIHACVGAHLGRLEIQEALRLLTARYPRARLAVAATELRRTASPMMLGYREIPVLLRP